MKTTIDHQEIKLWSQAHDGKPEILFDPDAGKDVPQLRINFPGRQDDVFLAETSKTKIVDWEKFFIEFEKQQLAFRYNELAEGEDLSMAYEFIKRNETT